MIVTVTLNPALDITYRVDGLVPHRTHRVSAVDERAGGKGLNVARVLHTAGEPVHATGLLGGDTGARVRALLDNDGIASAFEPIGAETRRTITVVDSDATGFWEPGPVVTPGEWSAFRARFVRLLGSASVVVLSGSLPRGLPADAYATLIADAREAGVRTVLDTSGEALRAGVPAGPDLVKPNLDELIALTGSADPDAAAAAAWVERLAAQVRALGAGAVVASAGADGLVAVTADGTWHARPPEIVTGNPTGAGDACVAALARGLRDRTPWPTLLADAVALSAAAVAAPVAGAIDAALAARLRPSVIVTPLSQERPAC
ncbi:1-phosphofructokinase family hexose kinase [Cryptosporangium aurantiacum]|uniref:Tagatose 6-phosphate kinase n=1 Tax=Cryptosporangium aurantiacum TaxID=134849 RepID=A0A1M7RBE0_9ACTN|nr:1-phosphofructokinase family hexose kinase [Cryptosporangium aurantiacum]SHN43604.1 tagatose 6-phosphate kinase [Cryptosporangium aurantiacum]